ncbi:3-phenylpropionate MFS transporter [Enterovibrio makurazakiensis]|uniref:3-phenylpropionate MFS transporter n=1 Tax=Enterovibrio makurazakiensis TaxID=2910232 RepID=UPI003D24D801
MKRHRPSPFRWLSMYYGTFFFAFGVYLPFWSVWLAWLGLSPEDIGIVLGAGIMTRFVVNLTVTPRFHLPEHLLPAVRGLAFLATVIGFLHLIASPNVLWLTALSVMINAVIGPAIPVSDALANHYHRRKLVDYGKARLWGSLAFVVGSTITGSMIDTFGPSIIVPLAASALLISWCWSLVSPNPLPKNEALTSPIRPPLIQVLKSRNVLVFFLIVSLIQGSHATYYAFSALHWTQSGVSDLWVGYLWSLGVGVEVLMFAFSQRLFGHWSVQSLFRLAALAVIVRWLLTGWSTELGILVVAQSLHGVTFGVAHLAAMRYIQQQVPENIMALQALYSALPLGGVMAVLTVISGEFYSLWAGDSFYTMALLGVPVLFLSLGATKDTSPMNRT